MENLIIVSNTADNPFAEDLSHLLKQEEEYSDLISLKSFLNREFCPRFISEEENWNNIGWKLKGKKVLIVSTSTDHYSRDELSMRNFLVARAAKDNGAERVILLEPDLFYSAQDRGPRLEHGVMPYKRDRTDHKKFDGQPFSARLYADLLKLSGVDEVVTIHNHSVSVTNIFKDRFSGHFHNLKPADVYAAYMEESDIVDQNNLVLCVPDKGALSFVQEVQAAFEKRYSVPMIVMTKQRLNEREVKIEVSGDSPLDLNAIRGKDVVVIDDMVRTGRTVVRCCQVLKEAAPRRIVLIITHFYASREGRVILNDPSINEIVTTNTIPQILNRDTQGRLRKKMVVLLIARWVSKYLLALFAEKSIVLPDPLYSEDMSSKNPRWKGKLGPLFTS